MTETRDQLERRIARLIAEHVTVGYSYAPGPPHGLVDPATIRLHTLGAAAVVVHALCDGKKQS